MIPFIFYNYYFIAINEGAFSDFLKKSVDQNTPHKGTGNDQRAMTHTAGIPEKQFTSHLRGLMGHEGSFSFLARGVLRILYEKVLFYSLE